MTTTEVNDVQVAYDERGLGDPAFVFIHGWTCDRTFFAPQVEHFAAGHRTVALDLRGHGESGVASSYRVEDFADDIVALIAELGLDRPVAVGHSLGGVITLALAARGSVRAGVMVDPAPIVGLAGFGERMAPVMARMEEETDGAVRRAFLDQMFLPTDDADRREQIVKVMLGVPAATAVAVLRDLFLFDGDAALRSVTVPMLSLGAAAPTNRPADLLERCPSLTIGQTVGSGHFNQLEVPGQVNAMIHRFLTVNGIL